MPLDPRNYHVERHEVSEHFRDELPPVYYDITHWKRNEAAIFHPDGTRFCGQLWLARKTVLRLIQHSQATR